MAEFILDAGATVMCAHSGTAKATAPLPRLKVGGQAAIGQTTQYTVSGCTFVPPTAGPPCVTAMWVVAATRVKSMGVPVVLKNGTAVCVASGTGLTVSATQTKVKGT